MSHANFHRTLFFDEVSLVRLPTLLLAATLTLASGVASAQSARKNLEPLPDIPPPPRLSAVPNPPDDEDGPQITIRQGDNGSKVEEFRTRGGVLYAVRVTPTIGKPYVLVGPDGKTPMTNAAEINGGVRPAQWTIFEF